MVCLAMTDVHALIAAKEASIAAREQQLALDKAELAGMKAVADLIPVGRLLAAKSVVRMPRAFANDGKPSGGRQPGAISQRWRTVLENVILCEDEWSAPETFVTVIKRLEGRETTPSQVRRILDGYVENGFVEMNSAGKYRVTETARQKFGLSGDSDAANASNENGGPLGPPDTGGVAAPSSDNRSDPLGIFD